MNNKVSLNNKILHDIVSVLIVSIGHASCTWPNKRVGLVISERTHCFLSYNKDYRKSAQSTLFQYNKMNKYTMINDQNNFLHILVCVVLFDGHY